MIDHLLRNGLTVLAFVFLYWWLIHRSSHERLRAWPTACLLLLTFFMTAVFSLAGISAMNRFRLPDFTDGFSFVPFKGVSEIVQAGIRYNEPLFIIENIGGNILMFVPLGFFLPLLWKQWRKLWKTALFGFGTTLLIECTQTFIGRGFDIDDLLLNTVGAVAGWGACALMRRIAKKPIGRCAVPPRQNTPAWKLLPYLCVLIPYFCSFLYGFLDRAVYMSR